MTGKRTMAVAACVIVGALVWTGAAFAQGAATPVAVSDVWPREFKVGTATLLVYQPQVNAWDGQRLDFRAAVGVKPAGGPPQTFGAIWGTARTQVDRVARMVILEDLTLTRSNFPTLPDNGVAYLRGLQTQAAGIATRIIALDRLEASLAASAVAKPHRPPRPADRHQRPAYTVTSSQCVALIAAQGELPRLPALGATFDIVELRSDRGEVVTIDYGPTLAGAPAAITLGRAVRLEDLQMTGLADESVRHEGARHCNCPHCGAPVTVQLESSQSVTCASCHSIIDLSHGTGAELRSAIQDGAPATPDFAWGVEVQKVLDAARQSDQSGEWVVVALYGARARWRSSGCSGPGRSPRIRGDASSVSTT